MRAGISRALSLGLAVAVGACAESPTTPFDAGEPLLSSHGEEGSLEADGGSVVYDFAEVVVPLPGEAGAPPCLAFAADGLYEEGDNPPLTFVSPLGFQICDFGAGNVLADISGYGVGEPGSGRILLGEPVDVAAVTVESFYEDDPMMLVAYDAAGEEIGSAAAEAAGSRELTVESGGSPIAEIGIFGPGFTYEITLTTSTASDPTTRVECMRGAWADHGFRNQGQCIRFVQTGQDSR